jgi:hypothetical protein
MFLQSKQNSSGCALILGGAARLRPAGSSNGVKPLFWDQSLSQSKQSQCQIRFISIYLKKWRELYNRWQGMISGLDDFRQ